MDRNDNPIERPLADALRRLNAAAHVPPVDPAREAVLLAAFDAAHVPASARRARAGSKRRDLWYLSAFAAAAVLLIAIGVAPVREESTGRHGPLPGGAAAHKIAPPSSRGVQPSPPNEFVLVPGAAGLPPMESGTLVRLEVPVSMLPSYGVTPPPGRATRVTMDLVVAQDGLPRAVRIVD
jgi:hypothetical protein